MFRQDLRCLFQMVSVVQGFRVTDPAINDIGEIVASRPSIEEEGKPIPLPRLRTFRLKDIGLMECGMAVHLGHLSSRRYKPLSKLPMAHFPHIAWDVCSGFAGYLRDHLYWQRYEAASFPDVVLDLVSGPLGIHRRSLLSAYILHVDLRVGMVLRDVEEEGKTCSG